MVGGSTLMSLNGIERFNLYVNLILFCPLFMQRRWILSKSCDSVNDQPVTIPDPDDPKNLRPANFGHD